MEEMILIFKAFSQLVGEATQQDNLMKTID